MNRGVRLIVGLGMILSAATALSSEMSQGAAAPSPDTVEMNRRRERLATLVGDWNVTVRYLRGGREIRGSAEMQCQWVLDGHFLRQEYRTPMNGTTFSTLQFLGYDAIRSKFTIVKMDSLDDAMLYADGELSADGRDITFVGQRTDMMTRTVGPLRQVLTFTDSAHFTLKWLLGGLDQTEAISMVHARKTWQ